MTTAGKIRAVATEEAPPPVPKTRAEVFIKRAFFFHTTFLFVTIAGVSIILGGYMTALNERVRGAERAVFALRSSVSSQQGVEVLFLKIIILEPSVSTQLAREVSSLVSQYSKKRNLDPDVVLSIIDVESKFNPDAESRVGAVGLMQLMPHWIKIRDIDGDLRDPAVSIRHGTGVFANYLNMYGDLETAIAVYNRGPNPVDWDIIKDRDPTIKNDYVQKVMRRFHKLKALSGG